MQFTLHKGDCIEVMRGMADNSVDSIVTDPPYELTSARPGGRSPATQGAVMKGFMGMAWDGTGIANSVEMWSEALRVLKPGGHLLAFSGSRTYHRMTCAIEDAGFEIRDQIMWIYGSGFPKSLDVSKAIDKAAPRTDMFDGFAMHYSEQRAAVGMTHNAICAAGGFHGEHNHGGASANWENGNSVPTAAQWGILKPLLDLSDEWLPLIERAEEARKVIGTKKAIPGVAFSSEGPIELDITAPATDAARQWEGWGTALKPAHEPICVARKPLIGTVAANVLEFGTGAINIDACRVEMDEILRAGAGTTWSAMHRHQGRDGEASADKIYGENGSTNFQMKPGVRGGDPLGRWPANVIHDGSDAVLAAFPEAKGQQGDLKSNSSCRQSPNGIFGGMRPALDHAARIEQSVSAARFFYCPKPNKTDRNEGCEALPQRIGGMVSNTSGQHITRRDEGYEAKPTGNFHPTVKPTALIAYLQKLVTPPGGITLDMFMGSGTSGKAAMRGGFDFVGIEKDEDEHGNSLGYMDIARARTQFEHDKVTAAAAAAAVVPPQIDMFSEVA